MGTRGGAPMPWSDVSPMDQKLMFVADYKRQVFSFAELCRRFGISRKTGYKWAHRFEEGGLDALYDRSRRPLSCPHRTDPAVVEAKLADDKAHAIKAVCAVHNATSTGIEGCITVSFHFFVSRVIEQIQRNL